MNTSKINLFGNTRTIFMVFIYNLLIFYIQGQPSSWSAALSESTTAARDPWSVTNNVAGITLSKQWILGATIENRYQVKGLNYGTLFLSAPVKNGNIGITLHHIGFSSYLASTTALFYTRKFNPGISAGIKLHYQNEGIVHEHMDHDVYASIGMIIDLSGNLSAGIHILKPSQYLGKKNMETDPPHIRIGMDYFLTKNLHLMTALLRERFNQTILAGGLEYIFRERFFLRFGVSSGQRFLSMGSGVKWAGIRLDISASYHQILGFSPVCSILYAFAK